MINRNRERVCSRTDEHRFGFPHEPREGKSRKIVGISCIIILALIFAAKFSYAQDYQEYPAHERTQIPADSRWEIIQSSRTAQVTIKLDKFTGNTYQLTQKADSSWTWDLLSRVEHKKDKIQNINKPNYQLFTSGIAVRYSFLLNVNTGATWYLVEDVEKGLTYWTPIE